VLSSAVLRRDPGVRDRGDDGARFEVEILGERLQATLVDKPLFDPAGERMRG